MPGHLARFQESGDLHFLTFSCHDRRPYFNDEYACEFFEHALELARGRYVFFVFGYVIMPEHVHLLVSEPKRSILGIALQAMKTSVAKQCEQTPFWLPRYHDFNVFTLEKHTEKLRYLHRNPVTRGLVYSPEDWKWSSYRHYLTGEPGIVEIESPSTVAKRLGLVLLGNANTVGTGSR
jgi:putative transposase